VPRDNHDRTLVIRLTSDAVLIDYRLELDEYRAGQDLTDEELIGLTSARDLYPAFTRVHRKVLANNLVIELNGKSLPVTCVSSSFRLLDHLRCDFRFRAPWKLERGQRYSFSFREGNYHDDNFSVLSLSVVADPNLTLRDVVVPAEALIQPKRDLRGKEGKRRREISATILVVPNTDVAAVKPAIPPDPETARPPPRLRWRSHLATPKPALARPDLVTRTTGPPEDDEGGDTEKATPRNTLLNLLLDTRQGFGVLLVLAAAFGAVHALTPGHGKTVVAAYLVGERGTVWHALVLGVVTTLTHTAGVLLLAALLPLLFPRAVPATVQMVLGLVGGLLIAGLGLWLLLRRLSGQADHFHLGGGHHHHHGHSHGHGHGHGHTHGHGPEHELAAPGWWGLVMLGITGGLVPCWDAVFLLGYAISTGRLWLGLPLLLAFSAGLAAVLVAIGIGVVLAHRVAVWSWGESDRFRRFLRVLPILSAVLVTLLGLWLCYDTVRESQPGHAPISAPASR
jgi:ABC-type nickel/cobalt efflux system permease component RcnA